MHLELLQEIKAYRQNRHTYTRKQRKQARQYFREKSLEILEKACRELSTI